MAAGSRLTSKTYNGLAALWILSAGASLLLPTSERLGVWLPVHLALVGGISTAIAGNMQVFALALTAAPPPPVLLPVAQLFLQTVGASMATAGTDTGTRWATDAGGGLLALGLAVLAAILWRAMRRGLNRRHRPVVRLYLLAIGALAAGGLGGLALSGGGLGADAFLKLRRAHMAANVLGWVSLTVAGTLATLLPTTLRTRMADWQPRATIALLASGLAALVTGLGLGTTPLAAAGAIVYAAGAGLVAWTAVTVVAGVRPRGDRPPGPALHLLFALCWFLASLVAYAVAVARGGAAVDAFQGVFLVGFVAGWALQALLGAWQYLIPMQRPGHPDDRRRVLAAIERGALPQVALANAGLALVAVRAAGFGPEAMGRAGALVALGAALVALLKAWALPLLVGRGSPLP